MVIVQTSSASVNDIVAPSEAAPTVNTALAHKLAPDFAVFPCSDSKQPIYGLSWKATTPNQIARVDHWWSRHPDALPAIHLGRSRLLVIDADGKAGIAAFEAICEQHEGGTPDCPMVDTPGGGRHYYFRQKAGDKLHGNGRGSLGPKHECPIDVRGSGGYVIAPGTRRADGRTYDLPDMEPADILDRAPEVPDWLHDIITGQRQEDVEEAAQPLAMPAPHSQVDKDHPRLKAYYESAFENEIEAVRTCVTGGRNDQLNRSAMSVFQLVGAGWITGERARAALEDAAEACGLVKDDGLRPVRKTIASGAKKGVSEPRAVPEDILRDIELDAEVRQNGSSIIVVNGVPCDAETGEVIEDHAPSPFIFDGDHVPPPAPMLVKGLFPKRGIAFIGGQSGAGKTFIAVDLAVALASQGEFFGKEVRERVGVVIIAGEGMYTLHARIAAARGARGITEALPIAYGPCDGDLSGKAGMASMIGLLKAVDARFHSQHGCRLGVVIIDTMGACFSMKEENSSAEANAIIASMRRMESALDALIIPVHHYGKAVDTGLRGSSAWRAGADAVLSVQAERNEMTGQVLGRQIVLTKSRVVDEGWKVPFTLVPTILGEDEDGEKIISCHVERLTQAGPAIISVRPLNGKPRALYDALINTLAAHGKAIRPFGSEGPEVRAAKREDVRKEFYASDTTDSDSDGKQDTRLKAFQRAEAKLKDLGRIATREIDGVIWVWIARDADKVAILSENSVSGITPRTTGHPLGGVSCPSGLAGVVTPDISNECPVMSGMSGPH